jgi:hypothetical protein
MQNRCNISRNAPLLRIAAESLESDRVMDEHEHDVSRQGEVNGRCAEMGQYKNEELYHGVTRRNRDSNPRIPHPSWCNEPLRGVLRHKN